MPELIKLSPEKHGHLKVVPDCALKLAASQHVMNIRVSELGKVVSSFPVFLIRNAHTGNWALSAVTAFAPGHNLFVEEGSWLAIYQPAGMQTYPLFLMQSADDEQGYTIGIDEQSDAFSTEQGEPLFDQNGKASLYLGRITNLLEADIKDDVRTFRFANKLQELGLIKAMDVSVHYESGPVRTLKGLHTIDEDRLQAMPNEQLGELNKKGYLAPIYAMLVSLFQLNLLIKQNNTGGKRDRVTQVKLEIARDSEAA